MSSRSRPTGGPASRLQSVAFRRAIAAILGRRGASGLAQARRLPCLAKPKNAIPAVSPPFADAAGALAQPLVMGAVGLLDAAFHDEITNAEALAFFVYATANGCHSYINAQLWSEKPDADVLAFASILDSGLHKIVPIAGKAGTVYRGYQADDLTAFAARYVPGSEMTFPAFTSASFRQAGAFGGNVLFIIRALSVRAIWWLSPNFHEEEALLPTGCRFRVIDRQFRSGGPEPDQLVIVLQEIDSGERR